MQCNPKLQDTYMTRLNLADCAGYPHDGALDRNAPDMNSAFPSSRLFVACTLLELLILQHFQRIELGLHDPGKLLTINARCPRQHE